MFGFVVLEDVLSPDDVRQLNAMIDRQTLAPPRAGEEPFFFGRHRALEMQIEDPDGHVLRYGSEPE